MKTVCMLYICTGAYQAFWPDFYRSFEQNFLPTCQKQYHVFTDADTLPFADAPNVHLHAQPALAWPLSTMKRFEMFLRVEPELLAADFAFFFNANLVCSQPVGEAEFLPRTAQGETLLMVQQPGFWNKTPPFYSYCRDARSRAYIPYNCGRDYVSGGLNGGAGPAFAALCRELDKRTEQDLANDAIPVWHDESELNRYIAEQDPAAYRLLTPAYWYPEGWDLPFEEKITVRDKNKVLDVAHIKGKAPAKPTPWLVRKWRAAKQNYLPYLLCARDALLCKKLLPPAGE